MKKRISKKQVLAILLTIIAVISGYIAYTLINDKVSNTIYYVVFDSNGGSRVNTITVKLNEAAEKPEDPKKEGYKFKYWTLNKTKYDFNTKVRSNLILVAEWEKNKK